MHHWPAGRWAGDWLIWDGLLPVSVGWQLSAWVAPSPLGGPPSPSRLAGSFSHWSQGCSSLLSSVLSGRSWLQCKPISTTSLVVPFQSLPLFPSTKVWKFIQPNAPTLTFWLLLLEACLWFTNWWILGSCYRGRGLPSSLSSGVFFLDSAKAALSLFFFFLFDILGLQCKFSFWIESFMSITSFKPLPSFLLPSRPSHCFIITFKSAPLPLASLPSVSISHLPFYGISISSDV